MPGVVPGQPCADGHVEQRTQQILHRLRLSALIVLLSVPFAAAVNVTAFDDHLGERLAALAVEIAFSLAVVFLTRTALIRRHALHLALGYVLALSASILWSISISPKDLDVLLGVIVATMVGSSLLFPWGPVPQAVVSVLLGAGYLSILPLDGFEHTRTINIVIGLVTGVGLSVIGAFILDRQRSANRELVDTLQREARISAATGHVAQELISLFDQPIIIERLCQMMTELLGCERSHAFLFNSEENVWRVMTAYGNSREEWAQARRMRIPRDVVRALEERLHREGIVTLSARSQDLLPPGLLEEYGVSSVMYVALRRGEELVGVLSGGYRTLDHQFSEEQKRIGRGVAHLASLALENALLTQKLRDQTARAEAANLAKDEFLAVLSHELRTPLNAILGWTSLLRSGGFTRDETDTALEVIDRAGHSQAALVSELLDVSQMTRGSLRLEIGECDPRLTVEAVLEATAPAALAKGIRLASRLCPVGRIMADPGRFQQIVWNLVSNAVKFSRKGGVVEVEVGRAGSDLRVVVRDHGEGINPEFLPHVFERFTQEDASSTRIHGGLGLGLAIVRHLVDLHGGSVCAESLGKGTGATFIVTLPWVAPNMAQGSEESPAEISSSIREDASSSVPGANRIGEG